MTTTSVPSQQDLALIRASLDAGDLWLEPDAAKLRAVFIALCLTRFALQHGFLSDARAVLASLAAQVPHLPPTIQARIARDVVMLRVAVIVGESLEAFQEHALA